KEGPSGGEGKGGVAQQGDRVKFEVQDTGVGIAHDHLPHIFDRFYRVPSTDPEKGLGLGLSFVAWIAKAHDGTVEVESELEKGTRFIVWLPAGPVTSRPTETPALPVPEQVH